MANHGEESRTFTYDVFLSFRGTDTRNKFIGYLRKELWRKGINTFTDDNDKNMRIGEGISPALSKAIEESKISIVVLSENYATSTWCLNELVKILDCKRGNNKQHVFPIFYHLDPSDVRHQRNSYGKAIIAHEERFGKNSERVQTWKSALSEISSLKGLHITSGYEINFIDKIVKEIYANITPKPLHVSQDPVGLEHRIEEVKLLLDMKLNYDPVCMLGIYGLGGIGKTELVKVLYNKIVHQFEAASFLANVREKSKKFNGMEDLQKTLLSEMFEELEIELGSTSKGIYEIKQKLEKKKVLLVLDDVDDREQLNNLAGGCDWFGPGSRIIITTRDRDLLISHQVEKVYKMTELNDQHSLQLFCQNAFGKSHPKIGYEDVSSHAIGYAKGLPLALKVIGSELAIEENLESWECALKEYEMIPNTRIQDVLQISYDRLGDHAKVVFLDIACFFKGKRREYVQKILEEFNATYNIKVLVNKSLLTIEHGCLKMHDLIQDMAREIIRREASYPGKRSRLWFYEDVLDVLTEDSGSDAIQGMMLDPPQQEEVDWSGTAFEKMKDLRILIIRNTSFSLGPKYLPNHLRLLDWEEYPSKSFPPKFHPKKIIVFNLCKSHLTLDEPFKKFSWMTNMNFSYNQSITAMPDVSEVQNLRELRLDNCRNLIEVHASIGFLKNLVQLSASGCTKLINFPRRMYLPSLEVLDLNLCIKLEHFPDIVHKMNKPLKIYMINTAIEKLPDSIGNLTGLDCIEIPSSTKLKYLPSNLFTLPNVIAFKIGGCSQLRESFQRFVQSPSIANRRPTLRTLYFGNGGLLDEDLHTILKCFPLLEELIASENNFVSLPACIKESVHLTSLDVSICRKLQKIPECVNLRTLIVHRCVKLEHISELPFTIQKVDARYCFSLSRETSTMLWSQVSKEIRGLEILMPQTKIPEWFDFGCNGGNPRFWARGKFPVVALALEFLDVNEMAREYRRQLVELHLVINGQCVPRKGYYNFRIEPDHVLVCDLRLLFSDEEWQGLDEFLEHDWNLVQVSYEAESTMMLSSWGVFMYKQGTNVEDVEFMCPDPKYSDMANISGTIVPIRDPKKQQMKMIEKLCIEEMFDRFLMESMNIEEREDFVGKNFDVEQHQVLMGGIKEISRQAKDVLEGKSLAAKNTMLASLLDDEEKDEPANIYHKDLALIPPKEVEAASTSGHQGSSEQQEIIMGIFWDGILDGLLEAQSSFPVLDIETTSRAAFNKGNRVVWSLHVPKSEVEDPEGEGQLLLLPVEMKIYIEGLINGLHDAKLSFPTLDTQATLNTVLRRVANIEVLPMVAQVLDWTEVRVPSSDNPLLQVFNMMNQESCESEAKSKLYWKLMEEHKALRKRFEEFDNETAVPDKDSSCLLPQYDELVENLNNTQSAEFISKKCHNVDDAQARAGKEGCKGVTTKYEKLGAVLKGRAEELGRLCDAGIEGFQNSEEFQDLMSAIYFKGLRDGLLEAQAILLALDMESITPVFKEHATDEAAKEENVTHEANDNENIDETIGITDIPSPTGPEVDNPPDTSNPSGSEVFVNFEEFGHLFF